MVAPLIEMALGVGSCLVLWTGLYYVLRYCSGKSAEWHCRMVTMIHAMTVSVLSAYCGFLDGPWPFTDPGSPRTVQKSLESGGPNTMWQTITVTICLGYFLFDLTWCLYNKTEGPTMLLHHCLSIFGMVMTLGCGKYGTEMIAAIFGSEVSNPFLQIRWFIKETGQYQTWYAELNDVFFMSLFGFMRIGVGSYLLYCYMNHPRPDLLGRFGAVMLYAISWVFWIGICQYAVRKYKKKYRLRKAAAAERRAQLEQAKGKVKNGTPVSTELPDSESTSTKINTALISNGHVLKSKAE